MEAIILAGGMGTRLREVISDVPKPMAPINGRPFLEILLNYLAKKGFSRVVISAGYMAESIIQYFGRQFEGLEIEYVIEKIPLGTGGGIRLAMEKCKEDHIYIFNGDTFIDLNVDEVEKRWNENRNPILIACEVDDVSRFGSISEVNNMLICFNEKNISGFGLINAGCYVFNRNLLDDIALNKKFSIEEDFLFKNIKKMDIEVFKHNGYFIDIGIPDDYLRAQSLVIKN
jgi:D-glycero-alpha-D-manno-heptose 1-phosphate guanylyltransferase